ncbi:MAG: hypothetical protein Q9227_006616 [Pyrenula ochraceoflavens]
MIELSVERLEALSRIITRPLPWKAFHVAGTNGKGTVAAYLSAFLRAQGHRTGRFTSPHLIDRWDCIAINEKAVNRDLFRHVEDLMIQRAQKECVKPSEFELLTATAFEIFTQEKIKYAVVECGMGGLLDATNIFKPDEVMASIITQIDYDHQSFLGNTLDEIATQKSGIMKKGVPCIALAQNALEVGETLTRKAEEVGAPYFTTEHSRFQEAAENISSVCEELDIMDPQARNLVLAIDAFNLAIDDFPSEFDKTGLRSIVAGVSWPGRLQMIDLNPWIDTPSSVLLDGAHNAASAKALQNYVNRRLRQTQTSSVSWVLAFSAGKDIRSLLQILAQPHDRVHITTFGPVDGMPWVNAESYQNIRDTLMMLQPEREAAPKSLLDFTVDIGSNLAISSGTDIDSQSSLLKEKAGHRNVSGDYQAFRRRATVSRAQKTCIECAIAEGDPVVIAGSLYLVSDILRALRETRQDM